MISFDAVAEGRRKTSSNVIINESISSLVETVLMSGQVHTVYRKAGFNLI